MSAGVNGEIRFTGTNEELQKVLEVLNYCAEDLRNQYNEKHDTWFIESVRIEEKKKKVKDNTVQDLSISFAGPYGVYGPFEDREVDLFERVSAAVPNASFEGSIEGFNTGGDIFEDAVLKDGILSLHMGQLNYEDEEEDYLEYYLGKLPYEKICELLKVDKNDFSEDNYLDFIKDILSEEDLTEVDIETFCNYYYEGDDLAEEILSNAMNEIAKLNIMRMDEYRDSDILEERYACNYRYDPITGEYI